MKYQIRRARPEDAADISRVIIAALRQTNAADYDAATMPGSSTRSAKRALLACWRNA